MSVSAVLRRCTTKSVRCGRRTVAGTAARIGGCAIILSTVLAGCSVPSSLLLHESGTSGPDGDEFQSQDMQAQMKAHQLGPLDQIAVSYFRDYHLRSEDYRIDTLDRILVRVRDLPDYSYEVVVLPDGKIALPRIGVVAARGLTIKELADRLSGLFKKELSDPKVEVLVVEFQAKLTDFFRRTDNSQFNVGHPVQVGMDGTVNLPLVGKVSVYGKTTAEAQGAIIAAYQKVLPALRVHVTLTERGLASITILGEVNRPGVYKMQRPMSVLVALALAGGSEDTADLSRVVLLRPGAAGRVGKLSMDLRGTGPEGKASRSTLVQPRDVIFVPLSNIAVLDQIMDMYVRKLLPFTVSAGGFYDLSD